MLESLASARERRVHGGRHLPVGTFIVLSLSIALAQRVSAQSDQVGRVEGVVYDSVHAHALAGAHVVAAGTGSRSEVRGEATSDSVGRYRIDSLPLGRYIVGFESPFLDSLEVTVSPREATVTPGNATRVALAMPPAAKLRAAVCPGVVLGKDVGVIYGQVVSAETQSPLADVAVALQWRDLAVWDAEGSKKLHPIATARMTSVTTDDGGWYRACGVPTGTWVSVQLQEEGRVGPVLRTFVDDTLGIAIRHLSWSASTARDSSEVVDSTSIATLTGTATLTGIVRGAAETPVALAQVHVLGGRGTAVTDAEGRYTLGELPAGTHELEVRRIGYEIANGWVDLRDGATARRDVRMKRVVILDSVRVVAVRSRYKEFAEHQKLGLAGRFLGPEDIMRRHVNRTSDIIRSMPGFVVENTRSGRTRVHPAGSANRCVVNVAIDGFSGWSDDPDSFSVDDVSPRDVGAIELYSGSIRWRAAGSRPRMWDDRDLDEAIGEALVGEALVGSTNAFQTRAAFHVLVPLRDLATYGSANRYSPLNRSSASGKSGE